jgi:hypothetical protein
MGDYISQRQFICFHVANKTKNYFEFVFHTVGGKDFLLKTLDVGSKTVANAVKHKVAGLYVGNDKRGKA